MRRRCRATRSSRIAAIPGPLPVRELMTVSALDVVVPHTPSTSRPQLRWKSSRARAVSGPKIPSTRPQSNPRRPSIDCRAPTSSPRRLGAASRSGRSPSRHDASTRASQVTSSQAPWSCRPRPRWKARTASRVAASKEPASAPKAANPAPRRRRWRSRIASPCCPGVRERKPEIPRAPAAAGSCLVLR